MPLTARARHLKRKHGLTVAQYDKLLRDQKGVCWICKRPPKRLRLAVDHDHRLGKVRGLLCWQCNTGLQRFADNPILLLNAVKYLFVHWR